MKNAMTWAAGILLVAIALYAGSYYALAIPPTPDPRFVPMFDCEANYRCGGDVAKAIYGPAHALDRRIRPNAWKTNKVFTTVGNSIGGTSSP